MAKITLTFNVEGRSLPHYNEARLHVVGSLEAADIDVVAQKLGTQCGERGLGVETTYNVRLPARPVFGDPTSAQQRTCSLVIFEALSADDIAVVRGMLRSAFLPAEVA